MPSLQRPVSARVSAVPVGWRPSQEVRYPRAESLAAAAGREVEDEATWASLLRSPAPLRGLRLQGLDLRRAKFAGADLRMVNFRGADLRGADLRNTRHAFTDFYGARLDGADLRGADLSSARNLTALQLARAKVDDTTRRARW